MNICILCQSTITVPVHWSNFIFPQENSVICPTCSDEFHFISGKRCNKCSRPSSKRICSDCKGWEVLYEDNDPLVKNVSLYEYNDAIQQLIYRWKYDGDYIIGTIFKHLFDLIFKEMFSQRNQQMYIVPIPLSEERLNERAFNQAYMLATFLTKKPFNCLKRLHGEKQAKKSRQERINVANFFHLEKQVKTPVLLVDDIYTTGRTVRHAASLLRKNGCPAVYSYTLIRG